MDTKTIDEMFAALPAQFVPGVIDKPMTFYFAVDDSKKTIKLDKDSAVVEDGKTVENADCMCKTSADFLLAIWQGTKRPGIMDFMSGKIKSNDPAKLETFMRCFGKG